MTHNPLDSFMKPKRISIAFVSEMDYYRCRFDLCMEYKDYVYLYDTQYDNFYYIEENFVGLLYDGECCVIRDVVNKKSTYALPAVLTEEISLEFKFKFNEIIHDINKELNES